MRGYRNALKLIHESGAKLPISDKHEVTPKTKVPPGPGRNKALAFRD